MKYLNPFHSPGYQGSTPVIENDSEPISHGGFLIFHRVEVHRKFTDGIRSVFVADVYDVVKPGDIISRPVCVAICAGVEGAKRRIDNKTLSRYAN